MQKESVFISRTFKPFKPTLFAEILKLRRASWSGTAEIKLPLLDLQLELLPLYCCFLACFRCLSITASPPYLHLRSPTTLPRSASPTPSTPFYRQNYDTVRPLDHSSTTLFQLLCRPHRFKLFRKMSLNDALVWTLVSSGTSVNNGIPKNSFLDEPFHLSLPRSADFVDLIIDKGPGCYFYKKDLSRAFRQIPVDPFYFNLQSLLGENYLTSALALAQEESLYSASFTNFVNFPTNFVTFRLAQNFSPICTGGNISCRHITASPCCVHPLRLTKFLVFTRTQALPALAAFSIVVSSTLHLHAVY